MPGGFPLSQDVCNATGVGTNAGASTGTAVVSSATANAKGAWVQLIASTPSDCVFALITIQNALRGAVDIGIGASGSEVAIVPNIMADTGGVGISESYIVAVPLSIPSGTRISARCQGSAASVTAYVSVNIFDGSFDHADGVAGFDAVGFTTASTYGTGVTVSATSKGAYSQLIAATTRDYVGFFLACDWHAVPNNYGIVDFDLAIGAAGSERIVLPDISVGTVSGYAGYLPIIPYIPLAIPAGTRIAARGQSSGGASFGVTLYGAYR